jgi:small subunit ribosomal protein S20
MAKEEKAKQKVKRPSAIKRDMQHAKRRQRNRTFKASVRTAIRKLEDSLAQGDAADTKEKLNEVYSIMDKGVKHGIFKVNKASRTKARLTARVAAPAKA